MLFVISGGDLKCCELELPITSPVAKTRLYLVSQTSGLVSFGRKKYEEERKSLNLIPVPVQEGSVQPVRSVQIPVCPRCPDIFGRSCLLWHHYLPQQNLPKADLPHPEPGVSAQLSSSMQEDWVA